MFKLYPSYGFEAFINEAGHLTIKQQQQDCYEDPAIICLNKREAILLISALEQLVPDIDGNDKLIGDEPCHAD
jgi:hypothetical protein